MPAQTSTDSNFERTFADLAYARMRDKAPSMLDYLIGFQMIDKNDEETHAVGVFAFKVGKEWVYAPTFFINGELKGYELMYIKSQDAFVPLVEEWVNYILNRRPAILGEKEDKPRNELALRQPDFDLFARSPYIGSKWAGQFRPSYNQIVEKINPEYHSFMKVFKPENWPNAHTKYAGLNSTFTIPGALRTLGRQAVINLMESMRKDAKFANAVLSHYDMGELTKAAEEAMGKTTAEVTNYDSAIPEPGKKPKAKQKYLTPEEQDAKDREEQLINELAPAIPLHKGAAVLLDSDRGGYASRLSDSDKALLIRRRFLIKDARAEDEKSKLYTTQICQSVQSPDQNGIYEVLGASGAKRKMLVAPKTMRFGGYESDEGLTLVVDLENKGFGNFYNTDVLAGQQYGKKDWESFISGDCVDPKTVKMDSKIVLVSERGDVTPPIEVCRKTENNEGQVELSIYTCTCPAPIASSASRVNKYRSSAGDSFSERISNIVLTGKDSPAGIKQIGETLFVPNGIRAFVLSTPKKGDGNGLRSDPRNATPDVGNINQFWQQLHKESQLDGSLVRELRLLTDGIEYRIEVNSTQSAPFSKMAMIKHLVEDAGLDGEDAQFLVKEARPRKGTKFFLKLAQNYGSYGHGDAPEPAYFPEPLMGTEKGVSAPTQYPQTELQNLGQIDPFNRQLYRDYRYVDEDAKNLAFKASTNGQKELLDTSVITGLVKTMDMNSTVDGYIGDLLLGLDRVGRILFMFYWHYDKFKERYGQQDLPELEDNLRNVFTNLGELTLFLKQKTIEPDQADTAEVKLTDVLA